MPLSVRPAVAADFPRWLPLWDGYNAFYGREGPTALPEAVTEIAWKRFLDPNEAMWTLVAEDGAGLVAGNGAGLVGMVTYLFHRSTTLPEDTCYLQDLFTAKEARGKGVGRALIEAVYVAAKEAGVGRVYWHTYETNTTAQLLYDRIAEKPGVIMYRHAL